MKIPTTLEKPLQALPSSLIVGGAVRDHLLGLDPKDIDVEVYGLSSEDLLETLSEFGKTDAVGKSFGVIKLTIDKETFDFSLPRRETKTADGHKGFDVEPDPNMTPQEAAARRDLTINALAYDPRKKEILDFNGGLKDLQEGVLRHTSEKFVEDELRPLRIVQFAARFGFRVAPETAKICQAMAADKAFDRLPVERVGEEFNKFLLKGANHLQGFQVLKEIGWSQFFPELDALYGLPQDPIYHPEGDVITHTAHCLTALKGLRSYQDLPDEEKLVYAKAVLCHDLGKATTTTKEFKKTENREAIVSPGHDTAGVRPTASLLKRIHTNNPDIQRAQLLTLFHMAHLQVKTDTAIRKLAASLSPANPHAEKARICETLHGLGIVVEADHSGRPPLQKEQPEKMQHILDRAKELDCLHGPSKALLNGHDLLKANVPQGKAMRIILEAAYQAQLKGGFSDRAGASQWLKENKLRVLRNAKCGPETLLNGQDLIKIGFPQNRSLSEALDRIYELQLAGNLTTREEALKAAEKYRPKEAEMPHQ